MKYILVRLSELTLIWFSSLHSELDNMNSSSKDVLKVERGQATDSINLENKSVVTSPVSPQSPPQNNNSRINTKKEQRSGNTLYQELSYHVSLCMYSRTPITRTLVICISNYLDFLEKT